MPFYHINMENYISLKVILDRIMRHPLMQDLSFETAVDYALDFLRIVASPKLFLEKVEDIEVEKYRAPLPCDLVSINQIREKCSDSCMRESTDSFHMTNHAPNPSEYTFRVQGDVLYTNLREGTLEVSYRAIALDEEGFPLVPNNVSYTRALEQYIKVQWFTILFDLNKIQPAVLQNAQQEYAFYVGQAQNSLIMPSLSEMESITNMWNTLLPRVNEFRKGFKNTGSKEYLKVQK